ncbi:MAG: S8 family peptidase [Caldilineaceae bacterium]
MAPGKVSPRARSMATEAANRGEQIPVIVRFCSGHSKAEFHRHSAESAELTAQSVRKDYTLIPAVAMSVRPDEIDELAGMEEVDEVWYDEPVHSVLNSSIVGINVPQVWSTLGIEGEGVTICVLDTGIDVDHPDFAGRLLAVEDFTGVGTVADDYGHGTHIASIAAGSGVASQGLYRGVAPAASLMVAKVLDDRGNGRMSEVMGGIEWAVDNGADVLVLSLSTEDSSDGTDALCTMVNAVVDQGRIVVVAAGNGGPSPYTIGSPGAADGAITVGATIDDGDIAEYSGRGPTADGRIKPEIVAPGSNVTAALSGITRFGAPVDKFYTSVTGSSMAAPHVAGVCALVWSANRSLLPGDVKAILMDTAVDLGRPPNEQGTGRVDALAAVDAAQDALANRPVDSSHSAASPDASADVVSVVTDAQSTGDKPSNTALGCLGAILSLIGVR